MKNESSQPITGQIRDIAQWFGQRQSLSGADLLQGDRRDEILNELSAEATHWARADSNRCIVQTAKGRCLVETNGPLVEFTYAPFDRTYTETFWMNHSSVADLGKAVGARAVRVEQFERIFAGRME